MAPYSPEPAYKPGRRLPLHLALSFVLAGAGTVAPATFDAGAAWGKFKSKSKDENTVDPAVNHFVEGTKKMKALDIDGAIDAFLQAIYFARNNYHPAAYFFLGNCYKLKGQDAKALDALAKHVQQNVGPSPDAHCDIAEILMRNDRDREAESELNRALYEFKGPGPRAHNLLGKLLEKRKNYKDAQWHFIQALGDQPWFFTEAWMNLAENAMKLEEWSEAISHYNGILARGKTLAGVDYQKVFLNMGLCKLNKGDHQGAMNDWHHCLELNQNNAHAHLYLAMLFDKEQHISSAIKEYKDFLRLAPNEKGVQTVKDRLAKLEQTIRPAEAEPAMAKPSPYMRQQIEDQVAQQRAVEEKRREAMENLESGAPKGDSGF